MARPAGLEPATPGLTSQRTRDPHSRGRVRDRRTRKRRGRCPAARGVGDGAQGHRDLLPRRDHARESDVRSCGAIRVALPHLGARGQRDDASVLGWPYPESDSVIRFDDLLRPCRRAIAARQGDSEDDLRGLLTWLRLSRNGHDRTKGGGFRPEIAPLRATINQLAPAGVRMHRAAISTGRDNTTTAGAVTSCGARPVLEPSTTLPQPMQDRLLAESPHSVVG